MAATVHFHTKTHNRAVAKVVGTADTDTVDIVVKSDLTIAATGNLTFAAADNSITRTTGSWTVDGFTNNSVVVIDGTQYAVDSATATKLIINFRTQLIDEVVTPSTVAGYVSDFLVAGQVIQGTPIVTIAGVAYSVSSTGAVTVQRDTALIYKLFGHDTIMYGSNENSSNDITVTFAGSAGGTIIFELSKTNGWSAINPVGLPY